MADTSKPKRSLTFKLLIGFGAIFSILVVSMLAAGFYYGPKIWLNDPSAVEAIYKELVFDSSIPQGYVATFAVDWTQMPIKPGTAKRAQLASKDDYLISATIMPGDIAEKTRMRIMAPQESKEGRPTINSITEQSPRIISGQSIEVTLVNYLNQDGKAMIGYELAFPTIDDRALRIWFEGLEKGFDHSRFETYFMTIPGAVAPGTLIKPTTGNGTGTQTTPDATRKEGK